jgi:hypothetical protein
MNPTTLLQHASSAEPDRSVGAVVRDLLTTPAPTLAQVGILAGFLLAVLGIVVTIEMVRRRREQVSRNRSRWDNFTSMARQRGLDDAAIDRMREMHLGLDSLHAPDAMLRIPAVYDRALDAWIGARGGELARATGRSWRPSADPVGIQGAERGDEPVPHPSDRRRPGCPAGRGGRPTGGSGVVRTNREDRMVDLRFRGLSPGGHGRLRIAFSRQGDGEYKASTSILAIDHVGKEIQCSPHRRAPCASSCACGCAFRSSFPGRMSRIIGPRESRTPSQDFAVTLLDLSGGGAMVSSTQQLDVESRGLLAFPMGETFLEGVHFVMLRTGQGLPGGRTCLPPVLREHRSPDPGEDHALRLRDANGRGGSTLDGCPPFRHKSWKFLELRRFRLDSGK